MPEYLFFDRFGSMFAVASDAQQYERALKKWDEMQSDCVFSVPDTIGRLAIVCSGYKYGGSYGSIKDLGNFQNEARKLAEFYHGQGKDVELVINGASNDLEGILRDEEISSVILIGHGALSYVYLSNGAEMHDDGEGRTIRERNKFDWRDVSDAADHLKSGVFVQRHCGHAVRKLSVPLGSFAMQGHDNVFAAVGESFEPPNIRSIINDELKPVCEQVRLTYEDVKRHFPMEPSRQT